MVDGPGAPNGCPRASRSSNASLKFVGRSCAISRSSGGVAAGSGGGVSGGSTSSGTSEGTRRDPKRGGAHDLGLARLQRRGHELHTLAGTRHCGADREGHQRHRPQELEGDPGDREPELGLETLNGARPRWPRPRPVLGVRVPRATRQLAGYEMIAVEMKDGVGHDGERGSNRRPSSRR